ncbi:hypothetical protein D3C71_1445790 [compost metagenome]
MIAHTQRVVAIARQAVEQIPLEARAFAVVQLVDQVATRIVLVVRARVLAQPAVQARLAVAPHSAIGELHKQ